MTAPNNGFQQAQGFGVAPNQGQGQMSQWELAAALAAMPDSKLTNQYMNEQQPEGQMISGHYVAPSWTQNMAALTKNAIGGQMYRQRDAQTSALINALRGNAQPNYPQDQGQFL